VLNAQSSLVLWWPPRHGKRVRAHHQRRCRRRGRLSRVCRTIGVPGRLCPTSSSRRIRSWAWWARRW
jgi:hypothetical protein